MMKTVLATLISLATSWCLAQAEPAEEKPGLSTLAAESDLVALAQVTATEYEYIRGFPSKGFATLRILIPYKLPVELDLVQVAEEGLKENECYFPETSVWQEGQRFLVFLTHQEVDQFKGHPKICALPVLVTDGNQYAMRLPQDAIDIGAEGQALVQELVYLDPAARIDATELTSTAIAQMVEEQDLRQIGDELIYTRGIELTDVRRLIGPDALETH